MFRRGFSRGDPSVPAARFRLGSLKDRHIPEEYLLTCP